MDSLPGSSPLLLRGGEIIDGSGLPRRRADLLIEAGRIARIEPALTASPGTRVLDAASCVVAPGFIDMHSHADLSLHACPGAEPALQQGVTSAVVGNCGLTLFPLQASQRQELAAYLRPFLPATPELSFGWTDLSGCFAELCQHGSGINLVPLVGQGSLRLAVMGYQPGPASAEQLGQMQHLLAVALEQGARGLSLGLLYPPGAYATRQELSSLAARTAQAGGFLAVHVRNEGDGVIEAVEEAIAIAEAAGARLQLSHQKAVGRRNWGKVLRTLELAEAARQRGLEVACDVWPYRSGSTTITALLPGWVLEGGVELALERLADPRTGAELRAQIEGGAMAGENLLGAVGFEGIHLAACPARPELEGRSLAELLETGPGRWQGFFALLRSIRLQATMIIWEELAEEDLQALLRSPHTCLGSDSWPTPAEAGGRPHPRAHGAFTHFLREHVLEQHLLSLEEGIRRLTSLPAACAGLRDRGRLLPGLAADLVVFDPARIRDRASFEEPLRFSEGIHHVLVNGSLALEAGQLTGARAGRRL